MQPIFKALLSVFLFNLTSCNISDEVQKGKKETEVEVNIRYPQFFKDILPLIKINHPIDTNSKDAQFFKEEILVDVKNNRDSSIFIWTDNHNILIHGDHLEYIFQHDSLINIGCCGIACNFGGEIVELKPKMTQSFLSHSIGLKSRYFSQVAYIPFDFYSDTIIKKRNIDAGVFYKIENSKLTEKIDTQGLKVENFHFNVRSKKY